MASNIPGPWDGGHGPWQHPPGQSTPTGIVCLGLIRDGLGHRSMRWETPSHSCRTTRRGWVPAWWVRRAYEGLTIHLANDASAQNARVKPACVARIRNEPCRKRRFHSIKAIAPAPSPYAGIGVSLWVKIGKRRPSEHAIARSIAQNTKTRLGQRNVAISMGSPARLAPSPAYHSRERPRTVA